MKPQNLHAQEDRLLDFVYGELPPLEARAVESHLEGCARCTELLNDIRGVRTTMSALPMESAPDAGLESLLAYAQQAARNAAAGPAPKPTWWRRWLVPVIGVAAVCTFGIISIQVSKSVAIKPDLSAAKSEQVRAKEPLAVAAPAPEPAPTTVAPAPMQAPATPPPAVAQTTPAETYQEASGDLDAKATGTAVPENAPKARLDKNLLAKEASGKKDFAPGPKKQVADWSNAGAGAGFERAKDAEDAEDEALALEEKQAAEKKAKSYEYEQRDAMTQVAQLKKPKTIAMGQVNSAPEPAPGAAQPAVEGSLGDVGMPAQTKAEQAESTRSSLSLNRGKSSATESPNKSAKAADVAVDDDFDDLFSKKSSQSRREQQQAAMPPPPPAAAPATASAPMPKPSSSSMGGTRAPTKAPSRADDKAGSSEPSVAELSQLAEKAQRSGNRVLEARYLRLALDAGATGSVRLGLLNRLCDAEYASGRRAQAEQACNMVIEESPRSGAAQMARKRMSSESSEAASDARPGSKAANKADVMEAPAATPAKE